LKSLSNVLKLLFFGWSVPKKKIDNIPNLGAGSIALLKQRLSEQGYDTE
jgi:hypothetical protein